jgi:hypothetical protein
MRGIPVTLPFHYDFGADSAVLSGELRTAAAWDSLRTRTSGVFAIAEDRAGLQAMLREYPDIRARAEAIAELASREGAVEIASYGVGGGVVEAGLELARPQARLTIAEYAPATVERLRTLFPSASVRLHDLLQDAPIDADLHLMHRIDTEFSRSQWLRIFEAHRVERIVFVPGGEMALRALLGLIAQLPRRRGATRAGLVRNRAAIEMLWQRTHSARPVVLHDIRGWLLEPRQTP